MTIKRSAIRGFSLVELTIVLGVAGMIIGAIWDVADTAMNNARQDQFSKQLATAVAEVRSVYVGQPYVTSTRTDKSNGGATLGVMNVLANQGVSMAPFTAAPFGKFTNPNDSGTDTEGYNNMPLHACGWRVSNAGNAYKHCNVTAGATASNVPLFAVEALLPNNSNCIMAVVNNANPVSMPGLVDVYISNATTLPGAPTGAVADNGLSLPPPESWVQTACLTAASPVVVDFVFRLTPQ